jgi:hypothetical protein
VKRYPVIGEHVWYIRKNLIEGMDLIRECVITSIVMEKEGISYGYYESGLCHVDEIMPQLLKKGEIYGSIGEASSAAIKLLADEMLEIRNLELYTKHKNNS